MDIDGKTKITGLFGYPVGHTLSPAMHNAAFDHLGLNYRYLPFLVHPEDLAAAVSAVRALGMAGVNVTVPHKEAVIPYLDSVHEEASFIGAVNTVVYRDGSLAGHNTDGRGFMKSLEEHSINLRGKRVLIVGAGGAARAIGYYLSAETGTLCLFDTNREKKERLAADLSQVRQNVITLDDLRELRDFDMIINATPLGLGKDDPLPVDAASLTSSQIICDLIYKETRLLREASRRGCRHFDGLGMLLWQGVLAFELWTGITPPVDVMKKALLSRISR